jgi:hypothetical protein
MGAAYHLANAASILLFLWYGLLCVLSDGMVEEFERFGISRFRKLTGVLEILGAAGLAVGYAVPSLVVPAAGGLAILMVLGIGVRVRARDSIPAMLPAACLLAVNAFIVARALER